MHLSSANFLIVRIALRRARKSFEAENPRDDHVVADWVHNVLSVIPLINLHTLNDFRPFLKNIIDDRVCI